MIQPKDPMWVPVMYELLDRIVSGRYPEGSALPSEYDLGTEFNVSRTVLRESVKVLTEKGLVTTWRGRGTLVQPSARWRTFDPDLLAARLRHEGAGDVIRELLILRKGIEPVLARMVAESADAEALDRIRTCFERLEGLTHDPAAYADADGEFHMAIVEASGVAIARDLFELMAQPFSLARHGTAQLPRGLENAHVQHTAVWRAILAHDGPGAEVAMYEHMQSAEDRLRRLVWADDRLVLAEGEAARTGP